MKWERVLLGFPYFLWASVTSVGAGILSIDSTWPLILLAPLFIAGGLGIFISVGRAKPFQTMIWLGWTCATCLTRAVALWGINQNGAGSNYVASWTWLCLAWAYLIGAYRMTRYGP